MRVKAQKDKIQANVHAGKGKIKRRRRLVKYFELGEKVFEFFCLIGDAQGAVSGSLLEEYIYSLPVEVRHDLMRSA